MFNKLLTLLLIPVISFAAGRIQNEDVKTLAELTGAGGTVAQLIHDDKIYVTALGLNKQLSAAITAGDFGTPSVLTTKGDLITYTGSAVVRQGVGSNGQVLTADSTQTNGIKWSTISSTPTWQSQSISTPVPSFVVKTATTANITLSGSQTIDGVLVTTSDLVLVKNQTLPANDGVYDVAVGAWTRDASYSTFTQLNGAMIKVQYNSPLGSGQHQVQGGSYWFQNNTLSSLADPQSWSITSNPQTFTVPVGVNAIRVKFCGGGGGGGGGHGASSGNGDYAGGGGGAGSTPYEVFVPVTAGDIFTVTPGGSGYGGFGGANTDGVGGTGLGGTDTIISSSGGLNFIGQGSTGGSPGITNVAGPGGSGYTSNLSFAGFDPTSGGSGGATVGSVGAAGAIGGFNYYSGTGAAGGTVPGAGASGGGGGGGGAGIGAGGAGGAGGTNAGPVNCVGGADSSNFCSGGGGAGGVRGSQGLGCHGGLGGSGAAIFYWLQ